MNRDKVNKAITDLENEWRNKYNDLYASVSIENETFLVFDKGSFLFRSYYDNGDHKDLHILDLCDTNLLHCIRELPLLKKAICQAKTNIFREMFEIIENVKEKVSNE